MALTKIAICPRKKFGIANHYFVFFNIAIEEKWR